MIPKIGKAVCAVMIAVCAVVFIVAAGFALEDTSAAFAPLIVMTIVLGASFTFSTLWCLFHAARR